MAAVLPPTDDDEQDVRAGQADEQGPHPSRDETALERRDRQLNELLQELRVMQTGVQVLFAFLLGVPFTQRFTILDKDQRMLYFLTLLSAGAAVLFLLAPGAWHRVLFAQNDKAHVVEMGHRFSMVGMFFVALSVCGVIVLIATVLYPGDPATLVAAGSVVSFFALWAVMPLVRRRRVRRRQERQEAGPTRSGPAADPLG
jgi:hypothetical protein